MQVMREFSLLDLHDDILDQPFITLSEGEKTKVMLAALFLRENNFLLIDEPTNHLDLDARRIVSEYLNSKNGFILVSHDRVFLDGCVDHILSINRSNIELQRGNFSSWQQNKENRDAFELSENEKLEKDIVRMQKAARQTSGWSDEVEKTKYGNRTKAASVDRGYIGAKSAKMMKRAKATEKRRERAIEEKSSLLKNIERADALKIHPLSYHSNRLVEASDLVISYDERIITNPVNFLVARNSRVALSGGNGSGKSSILKLILGEPIPHTGSLYIASGLKISYLPQDTSFLAGDLSNYAARCGIDESLFKTILRKLDFERIQFDKDMKDFSAGQRKKVAIARSLSEEAHLYIWDEPLNYIDLLSRIQITSLIEEYQPTLLFVEHDRQFLDDIATEVVAL